MSGSYDVLGKELGHWVSGLAFRTDCVTLLVSGRASIGIPKSVNFGSGRGQGSFEGDRTEL